MKEIKTIWVIFLLVGGFFSVFSIGADERDENINVFLVLDKSLSMEEEIEDVKSYVRSTIVNDLLIQGDHFTVITFYGKNEILIDRNISAGSSKDQVHQAIDSILADGRFTDIGLALDQLVKTVRDTPLSDSGRNYLLLLTDGKQEARPESPYYTEDGKFNHRLLENTKEIAREGWKIHILGIGTESAARDIADALAGGYSEVSVSGSEKTEDGTSSGSDAAGTAGDGSSESSADSGSDDSSASTNISAISSSDLLGRIDVIGVPEVVLKYGGKKGVCKIHLESLYFEEPVSITLGKISMILDKQLYEAVPEDSILTILPGQSGIVEIPFDTDQIPVGDHEGELRFQFVSGQSFSPGAFDISSSVPSFLGAYWWALLIGVLAIAGLVIFIILLIRGMIFKKQSEKKDGGENGFPL